MRWHSVLLIVSLLTRGTQGFAPIQWVRPNAGGQTLMPKGFFGNIQGLSPPQELMVGRPDKNSPSMVPRFTAKADNTITWDDMGWCVEAGGRTKGDAVRVNQCNGGAAQKWNWVPDGRGRSMIQLIDSNQCLDVREGGLNGAPIALQDCASQVTDAWKFEESLPLPNQDPAQSLGSDMRHAMVSLLGLAGVSLLSVGAWLWRRQNKARVATAGHGDVSMGMRWSSDIQGNDVRPIDNVKRAGKISAMAEGMPTVLVNVEGEYADDLIQNVEVDAMALLHAADLAGELSLTLCDETFIQELNAQWRGKDAPTDILSFPMDDDVLLGDLVVCIEVAARQAVERCYSTRDEVRVLLVHGLLHLLGYDHEVPDEAQEMVKAERRLLDRLEWNGEGLISAATSLADA